MSHDELNIYQQLLAELQQLNTRQGQQDPSPEERNMLSLVAYDALQNIDIRQRHPTFYARLLANPILRDEFLELLALLEQDPAPDPELTDLPVDLSFLDEEPLQPQYESKLSGEWNIAFYIPSERIEQKIANSILHSPTAETRRGLGLDFSNRDISLFDEEVEINGGSHRVILQVRIDPEHIDRFDLTLIIEAEEKARFTPPLMALIDWGPYRVEQKIIRGGRHSLPPLIAKELEAPDQTVAPLNITLSH